MDESGNISDYTIINLAGTKYYIGGFPTKVISVLSKETIKEIQLKSAEILNIEHKMSIYGNVKRISAPTDLIFIINDDLSKIIIMKPDDINTKQTIKAWGIIVCKKLYTYIYNIPQQIWESQNFEN
ncbi:hypothetical protein QKT26_gp12 [Carcinus maenas nudivirus]|uniref:Uncharacterized protein n=1 Tax=Carcinus maenas nudivirus TaxID=2880837 RepID=A0AAE9BZ47_9VIRU|nr:hypothetical protein QKT26_gp12 [Carcinus maenas nudivirus]UBZ25602.1 hypothetical protein CmNV_012 [Carcinus maenas nudivirus]